MSIDDTLTAPDGLSATARTALHRHKERGRAKKRLVGERALADLDSWIAEARHPSSLGEGQAAQRPGWGTRVQAADSQLGPHIPTRPELRSGHPPLKRRDVIHP